MASLDLSGDPRSSIEKPLDITGDATISSNLVVTGTVTAADFLFGSSGPTIGELYTAAGTSGASQAMATSVFTKLTSWTAANHTLNLSATTSNASIAVTSSGYYQVLATIEVQTSAAGTYNLQIHAADTTQDNLRQVIRTTVAAVDYPVSFSGYLSLAANTSVDIRGQSTTAAGSLFITNGSFSLKKVG